MLLENKVAIVTGGARGIGYAIARRFLDEGARVVIADIDDTAGPRAAEELSVFGSVRYRRMRRRRAARRAQHDRGDGRRLRRRRHAGQQCRRSSPRPISSTSTRPDFDRVLRVNLKGAFLCAQAAARHMVERIEAGGSPGAIVNLSSVNAIFAIANQVPYSVSKGGINQLTKVMALSLAPHGIRVNAIGPGSIATEMLDSVIGDPEARQQDPVADAARADRRAEGDRGDRRLPCLRRGELHHRPDDLCRRRPAAAELHGPGRGIAAGAVEAGIGSHDFAGDGS